MKKLNRSFKYSAASTHIFIKSMVLFFFGYNGSQHGKKQVNGSLYSEEIPNLYTMAVGSPRRAMMDEQYVQYSAENKKKHRRYQ